MRLNGVDRFKFSRYADDPSSIPSRSFATVKDYSARWKSLAKLRDAAPDDKTYKQYFKMCEEMRKRHGMRECVFLEYIRKLDPSR